jgi:hypothetical protein
MASTRIYPLLFTLLLASPAVVTAADGEGKADDTDTMPAVDAAEERQQLVAHLERTRDLFLDSVAGLTEEQWRFKPAEDRWSIAEVAEHVALAEDFLRDIVENEVLTTPSAPERHGEVAGKEEQIVTFMADRSQKVQAPDQLQPTGRWETPEEILGAFRTSRQQTLDLAGDADGPNLRDHVYDHPGFGTSDAYQWLLFLSSHTERHTEQIEEVKADPAFPG